MRSQLSPSVWLSTRRDCQTWFCIIRDLFVEDSVAYVGNKAPMSGTVLPIRPIGRNCPYLPPWVASLS